MISPALAATAEGAHDLPFYADPTFWVAIALLLVIVAFARPVLRAITAGLDTRAAQIRTKLEEARKLREDAQALLAEYQRKQRDALGEAEDIIAHAKAEAERVRADAEVALEESIRRREQQAMERIANAEAEALRQVRNQAVDIAIAAAGRLLQDNLPAAKADALVEQTIRDLPAKLH
ncbi:F0F1 ATP synthase subunit B [Caenispirillum bisanense]|uniref:ATP synthase subunit b n=1 Tax=Caenispirillum bisanense TaxID=414052 RepID=A0A286GW28_9PROT|nr:F0F1 ATP synthase subunit B [Caenispirillum bisanense]SOD99692.1 F-type H+-transporting ATPase subunit b [Caenispirillum bisanense]